MKLTYAILVGTLVLVFAGLSFTVTTVSNKQIAKQTEERASMDVLSKSIAALAPHKTFNETLRGKVVVINLWGGWCKPCLKEIPELNKLVKDFDSKGVRFIALSREDEESDLDALKKADLNFDYEKIPLAVKELKFFQQLKLEHEFGGYPLNLILDREGKLVFYKSGYDKENIKEMRNILKALTQNS